MYLVPIHINSMIHQLKLVCLVVTNTGEEEKGRLYPDSSCHIKHYTLLISIFSFHVR